MNLIFSHTSAPVLMHVKHPALPEHRQMIKEVRMCDIVIYDKKYIALAGVATVD